MFGSDSNSLKGSPHSRPPHRLLSFSASMFSNLHRSPTIIVCISSQTPLFPSTLPHPHTPSPSFPTLLSLRSFSCRAPQCCIKQSNLLHSQCHKRSCLRTNLLIMQCMRLRVPTPVGGKGFRACCFLSEQLSRRKYLIGIEFRKYCVCGGGARRPRNCIGVVSDKFAFRNLKQSSF